MTGLRQYRVGSSALVLASFVALFIAYLDRNIAVAGDLGWSEMKASCPPFSLVTWRRRLSAGCWRISTAAKSVGGLAGGLVTVYHSYAAGGIGLLCRVNSGANWPGFGGGATEPGSAQLVGKWIP